MTAFGTVEYLEIIWTLAAIPGFYLWFKSYLSSRKSLKATRHLKEGNGRLLWARFSTQLTSLMFTIELVFVIIGAFAMLRQPNPSANLLSTLIIAGALIVTSIFISLLAYRWDVVEREILTVAKARRDEVAKLNLRESSINKREVKQNTRDTDQNIRTFKQDERDKEAESPTEGV